MEQDLNNPNFWLSEKEILAEVEQLAIAYDLYDKNLNYIHTYAKKPYKKFMKTECETYLHKAETNKSSYFITCDKELIRKTTNIPSKKGIERIRYQLKEIIQNYFENV